MLEMHLRQPTALGKPWFTYGASRPFTKNKERAQKFKETQDLRYIYRNVLVLDKAVFQQDMVYGDFKYFLKRQLSIKYRLIKHLILQKMQNIMVIKESSFDGL